MDLFPYLRLVVVGFNFHLGHNRDVHADDLARWMTNGGVRVDIVPALKDNDESISSSRIRRAVAVGDLSWPRYCLVDRTPLLFEGSHYRPIVTSAASCFLLQDRISVTLSGRTQTARA